jgi:hypothetical protein
MDPAIRRAAALEAAFVAARIAKGSRDLLRPLRNIRQTTKG